jgi:hypothetical protein
MAVTESTPAASRLFNDFALMLYECHDPACPGNETPDRACNFFNYFCAILTLGMQACLLFLPECCFFF